MLEKLQFAVTIIGLIIGPKVLLASTVVVIVSLVDGTRQLQEKKDSARPSSGPGDGR